MGALEIKDVALVPKTPQGTSQVKNLSTNMLDYALQCWSEGDWGALASLTYRQLLGQSARPLLATLAAAGHQHYGNSEAAKEFLSYASDWGCPRTIVFEVMIDSVHRTLHCLHILRQVVPILGSRSKEFNAYVDRLHHEYTATQASQDAKRIFEIPCQLNGRQLKLAFSVTHPHSITIDAAGTLSYSLPDGKDLWLFTHTSKNFEVDTPPVDPIYLPENIDHRLSLQWRGLLNQPPKLQVYEYNQGKKTNVTTWVMDGEFFSRSFRVSQGMSHLAFGIKLAGKGSLDIKSIAISLDIIDCPLKASLEKQIVNITRQIESFINLKEFLGPDFIIPTMHGWPISPDLGILAVSKILEKRYDGIIEFGSGVSTQILASALNKTGKCAGKRGKRVLTFEHLPEFAKKTRENLKLCRLQSSVRLECTPLIPWNGPDGRSYQYYDCESALRTFCKGLPKTKGKILLFVDGPPGNTCLHARFPALPLVLTHLKGIKQIDILLDDYVRQEEREISEKWREYAASMGYEFNFMEFNLLEKKACLLEIKLPIKHFSKNFKDRDLA